MTNLDSQKFDCQLVDNFYVLLSLINFHKTLAGGGTQRVGLCQQSPTSLEVGKDQC